MLLVLEDAAIANLAQNVALASAFPFLNAIKTLPARSCCHGRAVQTVDTNQIKYQIAALSDEAKIQFKQLAGVENIRIIYNYNGLTIDTTI